MSVLTVTLLAQSLLGDRSHRLLSAAQAAKMAVVYSQYTSLYVLTNAVRWTEESSHPDFCRMRLFDITSLLLSTHLHSFLIELSRDVNEQTQTSSSSRLLKAPACYPTVSP